MNCPIVRVAVDDWTTKDLRDHARKAIRGTGEKIDSKIFDRFANRLSYVQGDFADDETYERVADHIKGAKRPVFYLEIPPSLFEMVVQGAVGAGLTDNARVVVEKPFGHELESARALAAELQVLLHAAMQGDSTCFTRQDNIEQTWRIVKPLFDKPPKVRPDKPGSWGLKAADKLVAEYGGWHGPWVPS